MGDKKHIDRVFQEKFKDFEVTPREEVWDNIEAKLKEKKKKRRVIPIWWRYAGVAALLLLLFTIARLGFKSNSNDTLENKVVDIKSTDNEASKNQNEVNNPDTLKENSDAFVRDESELLNAVASENEKIKKENEKVLKSPTKKNALPKDPESSIIVASSNESMKDDYIIENRINTPENKKSQVANNSEDKKSENILPNNKVGIAKAQTEKEIKENTEQGIIFDRKKTNQLLKNLSKNDTIAIADNNIKQVDNQEKPKEDDNLLSIEEAINKDKDINEEEKFNRWSIAPNAAPVYFNSLGEGSSIDQQFKSNSKTGDINMSYGVRASYAVNKKLTIRSGINRVSLGYTTNDVIAFQSLASRTNSLSQLPNIKSNYSVNEVNTSSLVSANSISLKRSSDLLSSNVNTSINQEFGYIEIPLEIQYNLLNKKFGINVIGGFSSFFLNENKLYTEGNVDRNLIGEASNINDISYSANFGLGINYKVSERFDLNLEPIFKYQINTFENTSGDFKPYFIGVYTGLAIKF